MSLISNLLKKVEPGKSSGAQYPPGLKRVILASAHQSGTGSSRVTTLGLVAVGIATCGVAALFVMEYLQKPLPKAKRPPVTAVVQAPAPVSPAATAGAPPQPAAVIAPVAPAPAEQKQSPVAAAKQQPVALITAETTMATAPAKKIAPHLSRSAKSASKPVKALPQAFIPAKRQGSETGSFAQPAVEAKHPTRSVTESPKAALLPQKKLSRDDLASRDAYLYSARSAEGRGDYRQALEQYRKAVAIDGNNYLLLNNTAGVLLRLGATDEATPLLDRCLDLKPGYPPAQVNKGITAIKNGNTAEAEVWFNKALSGDPGNRHALMSSGLLKEKAKDYKGAAAVYRKLSETGDGQGFVGMGRIAEAEGNKAEATKIYRAALGRETLSPEIRRQLNERLGAVER